MTVTSTTTPSRTIQLPFLPATGLSTPKAATVRNAVKVYGRGDNEVRALDGVSVEFAAGRFTAIMGPSGSGKSTLMHSVAGLDQLTSGTVLIGDTDISTLNDRKLTQLRRDRIGFIFQAFNLVPTLTAAENIALPSKLAGRTIDPEWFAHVIDTVGRNCPADSSNESPSHVHSRHARRSSSPTNRPGTSTRSPAPKSCRSCVPLSVNSARRS